jgi:hypothetical protein
MMVLGGGAPHERGIPVSECATHKIAPAPSTPPWREKCLAGPQGVLGRGACFDLGGELVLKLET